MPQATAVQMELKRGCLLNKAQVKRYCLLRAKMQGRAGVITRVGDEVLWELEEVVMRAITQMVQHHPSGMRTLKPF